MASVIDLDVKGFQPGSIIADLDIILRSGAAAVSIEEMQSAVETTITNGNFTGFLNTSFIPVVKGFTGAASNVSFDIIVLLLLLLLL